jgi:hypothetical protein
LELLLSLLLILPQWGSLKPESPLVLLILLLRHEVRHLMHNLQSLTNGGDGAQGRQIGKCILQTPAW